MQSAWREPRKLQRSAAARRAASVPHPLRPTLNKSRTDVATTQAVPVSLKRLGLSQVINGLLGLGG